MSPTPQRIGRYELVDRLGEGGMGTLYLARDPALGRTVAIKLLSVRSPELRERFEREARAAAALKHHNIVTIYDVGDEDGQPFIAMEFIAGETIAEIVGARAPLSLPRRLELLEELCGGLGYAHRSGIVHRDIKPANLIVSTEGPLKILDFGLARVLSGPAQAELTRVGVMVGTPHYMSPEQIEGRAIDHRTDIFSVGLVIYELLSYRRAYPGDSPYGVVHKVLTSEPEALDRLVPGIDPALPAIVARAIQKDPAARYQDLASLGSDLARVRQRLARTSSEPTIVVDGPADEPRRTATPSPFPRPMDRDALARRRRLEIQRHLEVARRCLDEGAPERAVEACESAALIDPDDEAAHALLSEAQEALVDRQVRALAGEARDALERGAATRAESLIGQAEQLRPDAPEVLALRRDIAAARAARARAERERAVRAAVDRAEASLARGDLESALRSVDDALAQDADDEEALECRRRVAEAIEARRLEESLERRARECVADARARFARGDRDGAIDLLSSFAPPHAAVDEALAALAAERNALEDAARAEAERARRRSADAERRQRCASRKAAAIAALEAGRFDDATMALAAARDAWDGDPELAGLEQRIAAARAAAEAVAERLHHVEQAIAAADAARAAGDLEGARRLVDAALEADPSSRRASALRATLDRAMAARRRQQELEARVDQAIVAARRAFDAGRAGSAIDALARFTPPHPAIAAELTALRERFEADERARLAREREDDATRQAAAAAEARQREEARRRQASDLVESARRHLANGDPAAARAQAAEALMLAPGSAEAASVRDAADAALRERRERERADAAAREAVDRAQRLVSEGRHEEAVLALEAFDPPHAAVTTALAELRASVAALRAAGHDAPRSPRRPTARMLASVAALLLLAAAAAGVWWGWPRRPPVQPDVPPKRVVVDTAAQAAVARARRLLDEGRLGDAAAALAGHESAAPAKALVAELYAGAMRDAENASREASAGGVAGAALAEAEAALVEARRIGPTPAGVTATLRAGEAFRSALADATSADTIVRQARAAFQSGRIDRALELAASVERRAPGHAAVAALASEMRSGQERRAQALRRTAEDAGASDTAEFQAAVRRAEAARRADGLDAVRAWREAADAFAALGATVRDRGYARLDDLVRRQDDGNALVEAERLLARAPADGHALDAVRELRRRAAAAAAAQRGEAQAAGARAEWPAAMAEAGRLEARAEVPSSSLPQQVRALWDARRAYERAAGAARDAGRAADQVAQLLQRGSREQAVAQLDAAMKTYPGAPRLEAVLASAFDAAVREVEAEAATARKSNSSATPAYRSAAAEELRARRAGRSPEGLLGLFRAAAGYKHAAALAPVRPPADAGSNAAATRREIEGVLASIAQAYESMNITAIGRLLRDTMEYSQLRQIEQDFKGYKSVRWSLRLEGLEARPDGTYRVTCHQTRTIDLKAGRDIDDSRLTVFTLRKSGDEWRVLAQSYP